MNKLLTATAIGLTVAFTLPAAAVESAACMANWTKMDGKHVGYVMRSDSVEQMGMLDKIKYKTAAPDRMTQKEYMDACVKGLFEGGR